jgi:fimbrial chaperone protein
MCRVRLVAIAATVALSATGELKAQSLRVSPVTIDLPVSAQSSTLTIGNDTPKTVTVQARVFRWTQRQGEDVLEKTSDVVVSPPILTLAQGSNNILRVVRTASTPVVGEETYRILIDEVPSGEKLQTQGVAIVLRQSLPVFFAGLDVKSADISWNIARRQNMMVVTATNPGQKRFKVSQLRIYAGADRDLASIKGLAGYVLGGQTKTWELPLSDKEITPGAKLNIQTVSDSGPINASVIVGKGG